MRYRMYLALAGASMMALAGSIGTASAQDVAPSQDGQSAEEERNVIVVTARRRDEALIDVPSTVTAVSGDQLQDFQINNFEEVAQLVAGLTLEVQQTGFGASASTRGVVFQVTSQGSPTVEQYLNEVPIEPNLMFQSNFDIGQIEVLRGPQGTLRGRSAPSGAITSTTRRPDMQEIGGYARFNAGTLDTVNMQAALGIPLIKDVLAVRLAGVWDENDAGGVRSANNLSDPHGRTWAARATVRFEPADNFSSVVMYQRLVHDIRDFGGALFGNGAVGLTDFPGSFTRPATSLPCSGLTNCGNPAVFAPPGFNGPVLTPDQNMSIQDFENTTRQDAHVLIGQADWSFAGQKLSYVGSYQKFHVETVGDQDGNNTVVGRQRFLSRGSNAVEKRLSSELRLASEEPLFGGLLDYTVGGFYLKLSGLSASEQRNSILMQGAFGSPLGAGTLPGGGTAPGVLSPLTYDRRYVVGFNIQTPRKDIEKSIFGTLNFHLFDDRTEFTVGGRKIWRAATKQVDIIGQGGIAAVLNPNGLGACPSALTGTFLTGGGTISGTALSPIPVVGQTYAGTCDIAVGLGRGAPAVVVRPIPLGTRKWSPFVYNFSLSHKFTEDLMAYASYGTSWRAGPGPITAAPTCAASVTTPLPAGVSSNLCDRFNLLDPETSKAAEIGVKAALFDKRLNIAVAVYRQTYSGLFILGNPTPYLAGTTCSDAVPNPQLCTISQGGFTYNAPAKTRGVDFEASFRASKDLDLGVLFSWSKGRFDNAVIPCRDANFDGVADAGTIPTTAAAWLAAGGPYGPTLCKSNGSSTTAPPWNLTLRGEYSHEVLPGGRAFVRGLYNYYPRNTNREVSNLSFIPEKYSLANFWVGLRGDSGSWEISVSAKNLFNNRNVLSQSLDSGSLITPQRNLPFANNLPAGCAPVAGACAAQTTLNSGYRSISFAPRREFALNLRYAFGSR